MYSFTFNIFFPYSGVGKVSRFSLFHGKQKGKPLDSSKIAKRFMGNVANNYINNLVKEASDNEHFDETEDEVVSGENLIYEDGEFENNSLLEIEVGEDEDMEGRELQDEVASVDNDIEKGEVNQEVNREYVDIIDEINFDHAEENNIDQDQTYGDKMMFHNVLKNDFNENNDEINYNYDYIEDDLTQSTLQIYQQVNDENPEDDEAREKELKSEVISNEEQFRDYETESVSSPTYDTFQNNVEALFKIPIVESFESFESGIFSNARERIPNQFNKIIMHPWKSNFNW